LREFTKKNPYSKNVEIESYKEKRLRNSYCDICERNGLEIELFYSVYIDGVYCNDCLETTSDGDGGRLDDHKFEPL
jgi:hypothetical protein